MSDPKQTQREIELAKLASKRLRYERMFALAGIVGGIALAVLGRGRIGVWMAMVGFAGLGVVKFKVWWASLG